MSVPSAPPPTYSLQESTESNPEGFSDAQLLICPPQNSATFQKGYLGATDEHAAVEGELQIKGVPVECWESVSVALKTYECADDFKLELNSIEIELYSRSQPSGSNACVVTPSSVPFSVPLTVDTPQCLHMRSGRSSLTHLLIATLHTTNSLQPVISRMVAVHVRRYSDHGTTHSIAPQTSSLAAPTTVDVQLPRAEFNSNEVIPVYVTIPPPPRSVVHDEQLVLRNVWAELIRTTTLVQDSTPPPNSLPSHPAQPKCEDGLTAPADGNNLPNGGVDHISDVEPVSRHSLGHNSVKTFENVVARSGSACCFHSTKPVRLRLLMYGIGATSVQHDRNARAMSDYESQHTADSDYNATDDDDSCASITQTSLLHDVRFRVQVRVAFLHKASHTEQTHTVSIPIVLFPPPAPLPEADPWLDSAYRKKHDRPPAKTTRHEDAEVYVSEDDHLNGSSRAGPSAIAPAGAPPPFEDAPPPFSLSQQAQTPESAEASTSSRLPTFLESEAEVILPLDDHPAAAGASYSSLLPLSERPIEGEGVHFGFPASQHYDGYSYADDSTSLVHDYDHGLYHSSTPPPTVEAAQSDPDVSGLARLDVRDAELAMESMGIAFDNREEIIGMSRGGLALVNETNGELPPPPPPLDDPSDPPPVIDFQPAMNNSGLDLNGRPTIVPTTDARLLSRQSSNNPAHPDSGAPTRDDRDGSPPPIPLPPNTTADQPIAQAPPSLAQDTSLAPPPYLNPVAFDVTHNHVDVEPTSRPPPYVDFVPSNER